MAKSKTKNTRRKHVAAATVERERELYFGPSAKSWDDAADLARGQDAFRTAAIRDGAVRRNPRLSRIVGVTQSPAEPETSAPRDIDAAKRQAGVDGARSLARWAEGVVRTLLDPRLDPGTAGRLARQVFAAQRAIDDSTKGTEPAEKTAKLRRILRLVQREAGVLSAPADGNDYEPAELDACTNNVLADFGKSDPSDLHLVDGKWIRAALLSWHDPRGAKRTGSGKVPKDEAIKKAIAKTSFATTLGTIKSALKEVRKEAAGRVE